MTEASSLHMIAPVSDGRPATVVAKEAIDLFRTEYKYSIADLCRMLCCSRDWIDDHAIENIRHIHLNYFFRMYVIEQTKDLTTAERATLMKGQYFFSDNDLARFWAENAIAFQKAKSIDLLDHAVSLIARNELEAERQRHAKAKNSSKEKTRHLEQMRRLLTADGYDLYITSLQHHFEWVPVKCPTWSATQGHLTSEAIERKQAGYNNHTQTLKKLSLSGAIKIKLCGKTLWLKPKVHDKGKWLVPIQATGR